MSHSQVLRWSALIAALFGIALLVAPNVLVTAYHAPAMSGVGLYNSMLYGAVLIGLAVINWAASEMTAVEARAILLGNLVGNVLSFFAAVYQQVFDPRIPAAAWINVGIFLVFSAMYARLLLRPAKPTATELPRAA